MNQIDSETVSFAPDDAVLVLEDGQVYVGDSYGAIGKTTGEIGLRHAVFLASHGHSPGDTGHYFSGKRLI